MQLRVIAITSTSGVRSSRFTGAYVWQSTGIMRIFAQRAAQYATVYPFIAVSAEKFNTRTLSSKLFDCRSVFET